jgi:hypothetical protein
MRRLSVRWLVPFGVLLVAIAGVVCWLLYPTFKPPVATTPDRISRSFPADGIKKIILRSSDAETCEVTTDPTAKAIEISGLPEGGAKGYHTADPNWRETPAAEWGLDFVSARHGNLLVVSTKNEILYIHHCYFLKSVVLRIPPDVEVVRVQRNLTGDGQPNLEVPKVSETNSR